MKKLSYILFVSMLAITACKQANKTMDSANGFKYSIINDVAGEALKEGEYAYFRYQVRGADTLLNADPTIIKYKFKPQEAGMKDAVPIIDLLALMSKGDSARVMQPVSADKPLPPNLAHIKELEFHVQMIDIKNEEEYKKDMEAEQAEMAKRQAEYDVIKQDVKKLVEQTLSDFKSGTNKDKIQSTASGLQYIIHTEGDGELPKQGEAINVNYYGTLQNGMRFDDSYVQGKPITFSLGIGQVIPGWDEGLSLLKKGTKATLFIPHALAYGEAGSPPVIPPKSDLVFFVELVK